MKKSFCFRFGGSRVAKRMSERAPTPDVCVFCDIARRAPTSTTSLLYADGKVVAFRDINPSAFRHYLVIPIEHIPTVKSLQRTEDDHQLGLGFISPHLIVLITFIFIAWHCHLCPVGGK